jgi:uncharacterized membrane protein YccC
MKWTAVVAGVVLILFAGGTMIAQQGMSTMWLRVVTVLIGIAVGTVGFLLFDWGRGKRKGGRHA